MELLNGIGAVLEGGWRMLTETTIPGLDFSVAALLVGIAMVSLGLKFLSFVLGFGFGGVGMVGYFTSGDAHATASYRKSRNSKARISSERSHDQF